MIDEREEPARGSGEVGTSDSDDMHSLLESMSTLLGDGGRLFRTQNGEHREKPMFPVSSLTLWSVAAYMKDIRCREFVRSKCPKRGF